MRRKSAPVRNGADEMIAAGREKPSGSSIELNGVPGAPSLCLHADATTSVHARPESSAQDGSASDVVQCKQQKPLGTLVLVGVGFLIGAAFALLYLWGLERQRQDNLAWEYYRTH
ncbi:hypothetical protein CVIRNUC_010323 [Coccomyxa viridis]|uniref:Uncharacterized protein n=1 Tax=Coccomyxa viridis TaxID=1274662 RepID=A0AAV1ILL1_9CHLO|nr:hypothetical protein CVIRNUC_010323 [Coccomyxa viridis]